MTYASRPIPTSVVRLRTSRIATYENSAFLAPNACWYRKFPSGAQKESRGGRLLLIAISTALLITILLLGAAAAQADPANLANQATIVRFANKVEFGAARRENAQAEINAGLTHFFAIRNGTVFDARQELSAVPKIEKASDRENTVKQMVQTEQIIP